MCRATSTTLGIVHEWTGICVAYRELTATTFRRTCRSSLLLRYCPNSSVSASSLVWFSWSNFAHAALTSSSVGSRQFIGGQDKLKRQRHFAITTAYPWPKDT